MVSKSKAKVKLTAKQEKFCQGIANGLSQSDAYRSAYSTKNKKKKSVWENASHLADNVKVKSRLKELKDNLAKKQLWTREQSVVILGDIAKDFDERSSDQISATKELNAMYGYNEPTKIEFNNFPPMVIKRHGD